jgi:hypothetical protein
MRECVAAALLATLAACSSPRLRASPADEPAAASRATAADFVSAQRARVGMLRDFASRGSGEMHFTDAQGAHHEQAQVELAWRDGGGRVALRLDKLGERFAWSGADAEVWWVFQLERKPAILTIGRRGQPPPDELFNFMGPESILELLGVSAWPESATLEAEAAGPDWVRWNLERPLGVWAASRARVDRPGAVPSQVQLLDATGRVLLQASHERLLTVEVAGAPPGAWPEVAGTSRFQRPDRPDARMEVFWDAPGTSPERLKDRLFDLKVLREVMRPGEIRDLRGGSPP